MRRLDLAERPAHAPDAAHTCASRRSLVRTQPPPHGHLRGLGLRRAGMHRRISTSIARTWREARCGLRSKRQRAWRRRLRLGWQQQRQHGRQLAGRAVIGVMAVEAAPCAPHKRERRRRRAGRCCGGRQASPQAPWLSQRRRPARRVGDGVTGAQTSSRPAHHAVSHTRASLLRVKAACAIRNEGQCGRRRRWRRGRRPQRRQRRRALAGTGLKGVARARQEGQRRRRRRRARDTRHQARALLCDCVPARGAAPRRARTQRAWRAAGPFCRARPGARPRSPARIRRWLRRRRRRPGAASGGSRECLGGPRSDPILRAPPGRARERVPNGRHRRQRHRRGAAQALVRSARVLLSRRGRGPRRGRTLPARHERKRVMTRRRWQQRGVGQAQGPRRWCCGAAVDIPVQRRGRPIARGPLARRPERVPHGRHGRQRDRARLLHVRGSWALGATPAVRHRRMWRLAGRSTAFSGPVRCSLASCCWTARVHAPHGWRLLCTQPSQRQSSAGSPCLHAPASAARPSHAFTKPTSQAGQAS
jgi:hypothetical protein